MAPSLLLLAASISVVFPPFEVDRAPGVLSQRLPQAYAAAVESAQCATPTPPSKLGPQTLADFADCADRNSCLGDVGRLLAADLVVRGQIEKLDASYLIRLTVFDVREYKVRKYLEQRYDGKLTGLEGAVKGQITDLCKVLNPDWKDPSAAIDTLASLSFEAPTAPAPTAAPSPPAPAAPPPAPAAPPPAPAAPPPAPALAPSLAAELTFDPPTSTPPTQPAPAKPAPATPAAPAASMGFDDLPPMLDEAPAAAPAKPTLAVVVAPPVQQPAPPVVATPAASAPVQPNPVAVPSSTAVTPSVVQTPPPPHATPSKVVDLTPKPAPLAKLPPPGPIVHRRPFPWSLVAGGGAVALAATGAVFGVKSHSIWSSDHVTMVDGVAQHSITHVDALRGNRFAGTADILFAVAAAAGVGAGVLVYAQGGLGIGGHF